MRELTHHHETEDANVWPFLESRGHDMALLSEMEEEHAAMKVALASAAESLDALVETPTSAQASSTSSRGW